jgi:hypothetical protein
LRHKKLQIDLPDHQMQSSLHLHTVRTSFILLPRGTMYSRFAEKVLIDRLVGGGRTSLSDSDRKNTDRTGLPK